MNQKIPNEQSLDDEHVLEQSRPGKDVQSDQEHTQEEGQIEQASLEAILFMYGAPIKITKVCEILAAPRKDVLESCQDLAKEYTDRSAGLRIIIHEDSLQMVTEKSQHEMIEKFTKKELEGDLTNPALEVLAIVAYRGPLSKPDVEAIRGVNCSFTLRNLLLRGLIERVPHPTDKRTKLYHVTHDFLRSLGLESIEQLPHWEKLVGDKRIDAILYGQSDEERVDE